MITLRFKVLFILIVALQLGLSAQTVVKFGYDNSGNRILRGSVNLPPGAIFTKPIPVGNLSIGNTYSHTESNIPANNFGNYFNGTTNQKSDDIFYQFTATTNCIATLSLCNSTLANTYLHLLNSNGDVIAENDDYCGTKSSITKAITAGTYYVVTEGKDEASGSLSLNISLAPPVGAIVTNPIAIGAIDGISYNTTAAKSFQLFAKEWYYIDCGM